MQVSRIELELWSPTSIELQLVDNSTYVVHVYYQVAVKAAGWYKLSKPCAFRALYQAKAL